MVFSANSLYMEWSFGDLWHASSNCGDSRDSLNPIPPADQQVSDVQLSTDPSCQGLSIQLLWFFMPRNITVNDMYIWPVLYACKYINVLLGQSGFFVSIMVGPSLFDRVIGGM